MLSHNMIRRPGLREAAAATVLAAALTVAATAGVAAAPGTGSSGSSDSGSGTGSSGTGSGPRAQQPPTQRCNQSTKSGGAGVTDTLHEIGRSGPVSFVVSYETYNIPDKIDVFYQGALVRTTGYVGDDTNEGTGSITVGLPAGTATAVLVRVTGPNGTKWDYTVRCP
ncbi:hypothetical protein F5X71_19300 [Nocardia brasiliensis]|uniref:Secreted protein n=1 Tax=Nocardia brasiliensis TaxID=37326 RepID=A0A6G9XTB0_NOCBR|nr:hypothetical protein [Nocardia brasiliensis]QIS04191.1 hypothetical protein F5X71_19300 [Nocardia brasiliensis]